eukprot:gene28803-34770_t
MSMKSPDQLIQIDPRSHLEVYDSQHRYAKNLRLYFKEYMRLLGPESVSQMSRKETKSDSEIFKAFFKWLDGDENKPELEPCPRLVLDNDRVVYLQNAALRSQYCIEITPQGQFLHASTRIPLSTGPKGYIFVIKDHTIFAAPKSITCPRFHHSSFFGGESVQGAGVMIVGSGGNASGVAEAGWLEKLYPHSGHYRPNDQQFRWLLEFMLERGVDFGGNNSKKRSSYSGAVAEQEAKSPYNQGVLVDAQRVFKVSRLYDKDGGKVAKTDSAYLLNGLLVLDFLRARSLAQTSGLLESIRNFNASSLNSLGPSMPQSAPSTHANLDSPSSAVSTLLTDSPAVISGKSVTKGVTLSGAGGKSRAGLCVPTPHRTTLSSYLHDDSVHIHSSEIHIHAHMLSSSSLSPTPLVS